MPLLLKRDGAWNRGGTHFNIKPGTERNSIEKFMYRAVYLLVGISLIKTKVRFLLQERKLYVKI